MSPEQALGLTALVDHRTDVYSLGVTLYELATLRHPGEGAADAATVSEFRRADWRPPRYWNPSIPVDFENIVLKAMAERRDERYATARELAEDLGRFLEGQPILARRPSLSSRAAKWARRHQRSVAAAALAVVLAMAGLVVSLVVIAAERSAKDRAFRIATANHARAEKNYADAQAKFRQAREMLDRFGSRVNQWLANDMPGAEGVRHELLAEMLPYYRQFARESLADPSLQFDLALTFTKIGHLSEQLGSMADAEQAYRDACSILDQLAQGKPPLAEHLRNLALCDSNLGQLLQKRGDAVASRQQFDRALSVQRQLVDQHPTAIEYRTDLAATYSNLGLLANQTSDHQQASEHFRAAIQLQEAIRQQSPQDETNLNHLAVSYNNLNSLFLRTEPAIAQRWVEKALSIQLDLVRQHPKQRAYQSDLALSFSNLGTIHSRLSRYADAERCFRDAITIQQWLVSIAPLVAVYRRDLAVSYNNLGMSQSNASSLADAEKSFTKALAIQQELLEAHPQDVNLQSSLGGIYNNLGMVHQRSRRLTEAATAFERAIAAQQQAHERTAGAAHYRESLSKHYYNYAQVLRALDRPADAAAITLKRRDLWPSDPARLVRIAEELATTCKQLPAGQTRQRYIAEAKTTLQAALDAGLEAPPNLSTGPFDVLSESPDRNIVTAQPPLLN
jgi:tetratricopeptide (TPR) repeat protein